MRRETGKEYGCESGDLHLISDPAAGEDRRAARPHIGARAARLYRLAPAAHQPDASSANYWAFFVFGYFLFFFMTWLPNYLAQTYHLNIKEVGLFTILPWASAAVLLVALGYFSDYLLARAGQATDIPKPVDRPHPASSGACGDPDRLHP